MPQRSVDDFISHWKGATAPEQSISQQFLCELCDLIGVPQPGNQRNGAYTFEFHVSEVQHDGDTKLGRIDLYKRACFILESKKFQEKVVEQTQLELAAKQFARAKPADVGEILATLATLGRARRASDGKFLR